MKLQTAQFVYISHSPEETQALGRQLAAVLAGSVLICLLGELGAGKTTLTKGLVEGLDSPQPAASPSFTLIHEHTGRLTLHHLDLYRLGPQELCEAGVEDALAADGIAVVEWAERLPPALRQGALEISLAFVEREEEARQLTFSAQGGEAARIVQQLQERLDACACG